MGGSPNPPRRGAIGLALVTVFLVRTTVGGILFPYESKQMQIASHDGRTAISFLEREIQLHE